MGVENKRINMKPVFIKNLLISISFVLFLIPATLKADQTEGFKVIFSPMDKCYDESESVESGKSRWGKCIMGAGTSLETYDVIIKIEEVSFYSDSKASLQVLNDSKTVIAKLPCHISERLRQITCGGSIPIAFYKTKEGEQVKAVKSTFNLMVDEEVIIENGIISNPITELHNEVRTMDPTIGIGEGPATIMVPSFDYDGDNFVSSEDNCPYQKNEDQVDVDNDNIGDECDWDIGNDGMFDFVQKEASEKKASPAPAPAPAPDVVPRTIEAKKQETVINSPSGKVLAGGGACSIVETPQNFSGSIGIISILSLMLITRLKKFL